MIANAQELWAVHADTAWTHTEWEITCGVDIRVGMVVRPVVAFAILDDSVAGYKALVCDQHGMLLPVDDFALGFFVGVFSERPSPAEMVRIWSGETLGVHEDQPSLREGREGPHAP